jgi:hypothetical protein
MSSPVASTKKCVDECERLTVNHTQNGSYIIVIIIIIICLSLLFIYLLVSTIMPGFSDVVEDTIHPPFDGRYSSIIMYD